MIRGDTLQEIKHYCIFAIVLSATPLHIDQQRVDLSFSAGAVEVKSGALPLSQVLTETDKALYQAKHTGRSRTVCAVIEDPC